MRRWSVLAAVVVVLGGPGIAEAGSISDFKDSVDSQSSSDSDGDDDSGGDGWDDDSAHFGDDCHEWAENPEDCAAWTGDDEESDIGFGWLLGMRPGWELSLGTAPYRGRYRSSVDNILESERPGYASRGYRLEMAGDYHLNQLTLRAGAVSTAQLDGGGMELFIKHTSTQTPGFALKYTRLHDFENGERLGFFRPTYEPNLYIGQVATVSLNLGWSMMLDQRGVFAHGPSSGLGVEVFPGKPWLFEIRGGVDAVSGVVMPHVRGALGLFATDRLAVELSGQHMQVSGGAGLSTVGLGVRFYQGW